MALSNDGRSRPTRREIIRNAGIAGAVAWTAPAIIDSLASPAAAVTGCPSCTTNGTWFVSKWDKASAGPLTCEGSVGQGDDCRDILDAMFGDGVWDPHLTSSCGDIVVTQTGGDPATGVTVQPANPSQCRIMAALKFQAGSCATEFQQIPAPTSPSGCPPSLSFPGDFSHVIVVWCCGST